MKCAKRAKEDFVMDNTFFDTAGQIMDNCSKVVSKAFDIGRKKII